MRNLKIRHQITDRSGKSTDVYLREVSNQPMITVDEEVDLAQRIKRGDMEALEKLVKANLRFAVSVAKQYQNMGLPLEDLISEANIGLIAAAGRYDETRGFKFISYAVWWIRQSILKALNEKSRCIRLPVNRTRLAKEITSTAIKIEQLYGRDATDDEIGEIVDLSPKEIRETINLTQETHSIDSSPVRGTKGAENFSMKDIIKDENIPENDKGLIKEDLHQDIDDALGSLGEKDAEIIKLSYGLGSNYPMSLEDIGIKMKMSKERVRQLREKALKKLRHSSKSRKLRLYI